jgi:hypothetical protein
MRDISPYFVTQWALESGSPYASFKDFLAHSTPVTEILLKHVTSSHKRLFEVVSIGLRKHVPLACSIAGQVAVP